MEDRTSEGQLELMEEIHRKEFDDVGFGLFTGFLGMVTGGVLSYVGCVYGPQIYESVKNLF